jgi:GNAT superfamily N-acetyltransferase
VTPPGLRIRPVRIEEAETLARLAARTFRDAFGPDNNPADLELHLSTTYTADRMRQALRDPGCTSLFAEVDGVPVGYAQVFDREAEPPSSGGRMLSRFYLEQAWLGQGIAPRLMDAVTEDARRRGARYLWLTVWQRNPRAVRFYEKCGFRVTGATTFTVGSDPQTDWVMRLTL